MKIKLTSFLTLLLGFCFFAAYPSANDVNLIPETHFEVSHDDVNDSSLKPVSYLHTNDSLDRIFTNNQNIYTPVVLKKLTDANTKANINKHQTVVEFNKSHQYETHLILSFLTTDIIFPFHNFW